MLYKASAPGRVSFLGEHAVLYNYYTIVCAVNKRVTVQLEPRRDQQITIQSMLGSYHTTIDQLTMIAPFQYVLATLKKYQKKMKYGCDILITADFSDQIGLASSAAVTVALLAVLNAWLTLNYSNLQLVQQGREIIRSIQGFGSGADIAASVFGGMIAYRMKPLTIEPLPFSYPFTIVYSGSKTPTMDVVNYVNAYFSTQPDLFKQLIRTIGIGSQQGITAIHKKNWIELGKLMTIQHGLMQALGVSTPTLDQLTDELWVEKSILGAKISGAGLGDCVIALGDSPHVAGKIDLQLEPTGVRYEKN